MGDGRHQVRRSILATLAGIVGAVVPSVAICALGPGLGAGIGPGYLVLYTLIGGATILVSTLANLLGAARLGVPALGCSEP